MRAKKKNDVKHKMNIILKMFLMGGLKISILKIKFSVGVFLRQQQLYSKSHFLIFCSEIEKNIEKTLGSKHGQI